MDYFDLFDGYGGFGYADTSSHSRVPKGMKNHSDLYRAAAIGDLEQVQRQLMFHEKKSKEKNLKPRTADEQRMILNKARCWKEVDYKMSGFTKEWVWFDLAPLAIAAKNGHSNVVRYLLQQGADPLLQGCPTENKYLDAFKAAQEGLSSVEKSIGKVKSLDQAKPPSTFWDLDNCRPVASETARDRAVLMLSRKSKYVTCISLLEAVKPFWQVPPYSSSQYSKQRDEAKYNNVPSDMSAMLEALALICNPLEMDQSQEEIEALESAIKVLQAMKQEKSKREEDNIRKRRESQKQPVTKRRKTTMNQN